MSADEKRILVTGGLGFIGSFLVDALVKKGHRVRIYDNLEPQVHTSGEIPDYVNPEAEVVQGDIRDYDTLLKAMDGIEVVFHEAAMVGMGQSQYQIKKYVDVNTGGTANLLDIIVNHKREEIQKMVVAASQSSYGEGAYLCKDHGLQRPGLRDDDQLAEGHWELFCPVCGGPLEAVGISEKAERICYAIYAHTKTDQEEMVLNIGKAYDIPAVALRYFNVYGPRQSLSNPYTGVAAIFMSRIKNENPPVIYEDGEQSRDFVSVHDIVQANLLAMEKGEANYESFNVGSGERVSIRQVAETLEKVYGQEQLGVEITGRYRSGDTRHCFPTIEKIQTRLGYKPSVTFLQGMEELVVWSDGQEAVDQFEKARSELESRGLA
ncbi:MAG: nucleoside-diphosphate-sugar epimerase [Gemmatimonadetes bacterium]|nr:nucleoside-diphosphate-sugar epimerase [Gemmatimonadota bacterium]